MHPLDLKEIQNIELNILIFLKEVCEQNGLSYGLTSGTLLGAIRHGGFIPWDDDIDIVMPRDDYEKLIQIMKNRKGKYKLLSPYFMQDYVYEYCKMVDDTTVLIENPDTTAIPLSVYIDIFPVDGVPEDVKKRQKLFRKLKLIQKLYAAIMRSPFKIKDKRVKHRLAWNFLSILKRFRLNKAVLVLLDQWSKKYTFEKSSYCAVLLGQGEKEVFSKEEYELKGEVKFENNKFRTYTTPVKYLEQFFGDYMQLPPEEQRCGHNNIAWRK
jgi:licD1 protein